MTEKKQKKQLVYKSNALIEASYRLTAMEQRILLACIAQVRRWGDDHQVTDADWYRVSVADIAALTGHSTKTIYDDLRAASLRLKRREVWIRDQPNGGGRMDSPLITGWVQSIRPLKGQGCVDIRFSKDVLPYISQLTRQFTKYEMADVSGLTSIHAMRIYELLVQWSGAGVRTVSVDWLKDTLRVQYSAMCDFKKRVIHPAIAQINEKTPLFVELDQVKAGRRITHLVFRFGPKVEQKAWRQAQTRKAFAKSKKSKKSEPQPNQAWQDPEYPPLPGEKRVDYFVRVGRIRGVPLDQLIPPEPEKPESRNETDR